MIQVLPINVHGFQADREDKNKSESFVVSDSAALDEFVYGTLSIGDYLKKYVPSFTSPVALGFVVELRSVKSRNDSDVRTGFGVLYFNPIELVYNAFYKNTKYEKRGMVVTNGDIWDAPTDAVVQELQKLLEETTETRVQYLAQQSKAGCMVFCVDMDKPEDLEMVKKAMEKLDLNLPGFKVLGSAELPGFLGAGEFPGFTENEDTDDTEEDT